MKVKDRNTNVLKILFNHLEKVKTDNYNKYEDLYKPIDTVFTTTSWGFRELILVITIAKFLNSDFKASEDLYACKPRALFEKPIREFLSDQGIPHRQSGPLNVAKNIDSIDENWAKGKRPENAAMAVVTLNNEIEKMNNNQLSDFLATLIDRFLQEAIRIDKLNISIDPIENPLLLHEMCKRLIDETPDRGNTPQRICGLVIKNYLESKESDVIVDNYEDSASTTNTTSNKPGDIILEGFSNHIVEVYEVTCKIFDNQRIQDSYNSIKFSPEKYSDVLKEVYVICREQDCPELHTKYNSVSLFGTFVKEDITYYFINIYEWILIHLINMSKEYRKKFHGELSLYISNPNSSEDVKKLWNEVNVF